MWLEYVSIFAFGVAIGLVVYRFAINKTPLTLESATTAIESVEPVALQIEKVIQIGANAAEGYRKDGTFSTTEEMSSFVLNFVKEWVPAARAIPNKKIISFIKSAALVSSALTNQIAAAKATVAETKVRMVVAAALPPTPGRIPGPPPETPPVQPLIGGMR